MRTPAYVRVPAFSCKLRGIERVRIARAHEIAESLVHDLDAPASQRLHHITLA